MNCRISSVIGLVMLTVLVAAVGAQEVVRTGPPPEIRALVDAVMKAANGGAEAWEAMSNERFSAEFLKRQSPAERKAAYDKFRAGLGTMTFERATREGPDAPLDLHVKGSTGGTGVITLDLTEAMPPKITNLKVTVGKGSEPPANAAPLPPVTGRMTNDELGHALDAHLAKLAADDVFAGAALVAKDGTPVFQRAYRFCRPCAKDSKHRRHSIQHWLDQQDVYATSGRTTCR